MKSAIQQAAELYSSRGLNLSRDLEYFLKWGYVFVAPDRLMLAREIKKDDEGSSWVEPKTGDTWYVHFAVGDKCLKWFIDQAPYFRPWIAWKRGFKNGDNTLRFYDTNRLLSKI